MTNYYTQVCFEVAFKDAAAAKEASAFMNKCSAIVWNDESDLEMGKMLEDRGIDYLGVQLVPDADNPDHAVIVSEESANLEFISFFLGICINRGWVKGPVAFQWGNTADKDKADAYGGGASVVYGLDDECWTSGTQWIVEQLKRRAA